MSEPADRPFVEMLPGPGMIALRGAMDLVGPVAAEVTGCAVPRTRGITGMEERRLGWMSPDELLLIMPRGAVLDALTTLNQRLSGQHHLAADVSDMRRMFRIQGQDARETLAKLVPVDLHPAAFRAGELCRTRLAQVACALWLEQDEFRLVCFRSVADYACTLLQQAVGTPVGVFTQPLSPTAGIG